MRSIPLQHIQYISTGKNLLRGPNILNRRNSLLPCLVMLSDAKSLLALLNQKLHEKIGRPTVRSQ